MPDLDRPTVHIAGTANQQNHSCELHVHGIRGGVDTVLLTGRVKLSDFQVGSIRRSGDSMIITVTLPGEKVVGEGHVAQLALAAEQAGMKVLR